MAVEVPAINADKLNAFMGQLVGKQGATVNAALMVIGDRLGPSINSSSRQEKSKWAGTPTGTFPQRPRSH